MSARLALVLLLGVPTIAAADRPRSVRVPTPPGGFASIDVVPNILFLNRCRGGCTIKFGTTNDARTHTSTIPNGSGMFQMTEFAWGDGEWNELMACMRQVWSPFGVTVTDVQPATTEHYNEDIIAGTPAELNLGGGIGGIAPVGLGCTPVNHAISFSFANIYTNAFERVNDICWTAAQEIAHTYGLDHSFSLPGGISACNDPMTYRTDCGGRKFFRDAAATCGEYEGRECACGFTQNTHRWLTTQLGAGTPITTATAEITTPAPGTTTIANGAVVIAAAEADRGVERVELLLNGYRWAEVPGVPFGRTGQPASSYAFTLPANVPDGVIDIEVRALDDLDVAGSSKITVTKGAPCATADSCLEGQLCEGGKCFWTEPTGAVGDDCTYPQFCVSGQCLAHGDGEFCTQSCSVGSPATCPAGFACVPFAGGGATEGRCFEPIESGCCSSSRSTPWPAFLLGALVLGMLARRR
ncbi:MAG: hypothetical protein KF773_06105 [Deltaproteobacteria bacterium]|nr:hypothetical protein [Deltaproteobacteria bacterium]